MIIHVRWLSDIIFYLLAVPSSNSSSQYSYYCNAKSSAGNRSIQLGHFNWRAQAVLFSFIITIIL